MDKKLLQARDNIIESAGRTTQGFGLGRIIGQLYALLFFSPVPMSLDAMAGELGVSKGSVSTNIRELEKWGAVRQVWVKGDRKDYYEAEVDFQRILKEGVMPYLARKWNSSLVTLEESRRLLAGSPAQRVEKNEEQAAAFILERINLLEKARKTISPIFKLSGF